MEQTPQVAKKREAVATMGAIGLADAKRRDFVLDVPEGHTREDLLDPSYWAHVAQEFVPFDRIEARAETGEWFSDLVVVSAGRTFVIVRELAFHNLNPKDTPVPQTEVRHTVQWKGPKKFCVIRLSDRAIISDGHHTRQDADTALVQYEARVALS